MKGNMESILKVLFLLGLILISILPNGTRYIPIFFSLIGVLAAYFSYKKDRANNKDSYKLKLAAALILLIVLLVFIYLLLVK